MDIIDNYSCIIGCVPGLAARVQGEEEKDSSSLPTGLGQAVAGYIKSSHHFSRLNQERNQVTIKSCFENLLLSFLFAGRDGDGVPNSFDNCPDLPNADQVDTDKDGTGEAAVLPFTLYLSRSSVKFVLTA